MALKAEDEHRHDEDGQHRHLHFLGLELLAEIFRRASDHQAGDEHGDDGEHDDAVETGADAARHDLADLDEHQRHQAAERHVGVVHGVDRAVGGAGREASPRSPTAGCRSGPPCLPCCRRSTPSACMQRIAGGLRPVGDGAAGDQEQHHHGEQRPALALAADHAAEGDGEAEGEREDRPELDRRWSRCSGSRRDARN